MHQEPDSKSAWRKPAPKWRSAACAGRQDSVVERAETALPGSNADRHCCDMMSNAIGTSNVFA
jgi:hypothetical protein